MKNLGTWTVTTEASYTKEILKKEERLSGLEDSIEEMDTSLKQNIK